MEIRLYSGIKTIYNDPLASVITNGMLSRSFLLQRDTRQGCPLSPLLFAIFIESLAAAVRQNVNIQGISIGNMEHKIYLYADDVLLYIQDPFNSLTELFKTISSYSPISDVFE